ncbi:hypothetical protein AOL_s00078g230 [Orbilia oligospora ATCC 24927]|uniref:CHAT domain-containing protein n=1 Tax=Arthrobotrys oligospora (strain ATCC 24927 / CBS 115.81 / DSM 1491) TaxID=756982 RepID=G1XBD3_ARTOA|nr:hypothetical protein AOL_s00078g230 [Orbilia oligospora ATCC 24927]EGX49741.1 hypothetical protein AOL_s00078g230 [Orbilia oligospora ATCC 24927]
MSDTHYLSEGGIEEKERELRELRHTGKIKELEHRQGLEQTAQMIKKLELQIEEIRSAWTVTEIAYESERFIREQKERDWQRQIEISKEKLALIAKDTRIPNVVTDLAIPEGNLKIGSKYNDEGDISASMAVDISQGEPQDNLKLDQAADLTLDTAVEEESNNKTSSLIFIEPGQAAEQTTSPIQDPDYGSPTQSQSLGEGSTSQALMDTVSSFLPFKVTERVARIPPNTYMDDELSSFALKYYVDLNPREEGAEIQFIDMAKEQLDEISNDLDTASERDPEDTWLLSIIYYYKFLKTGSLDDIQSAIKGTEEVLLDMCTQVDDPDYAFYLKSLITMLMQKYWCTDSIADLNQAIIRGEEMLTMGHHDYLSQLLDLMKMKRIKACKTGSYEEVEEMRVICDTVLIEKNLDIVMNCSLAKYFKTRDVKNLESALEVAGSQNHPMKAVLLFTLSTFFKDEFDQTADFDDLKTAIKRGEEALALNHHDNKLVIEMSHHIARLYVSKFKITDDLNDLEIAIKRVEGAIDPNAAYSANGLLADLLETKFDRTGNLEDLLAAVGRAEDAVAAERNSIELGNIEGKAHRLNTLSVLLRRKFLYSRAEKLDDLERAIAVAEEGIEVLIFDEAAKKTRLYNLGGHLLTLYQKTGNLNDLTRAIDSAQKALDLALMIEPKDDASLGAIQGLLAVCFWEMFSRTGNLEDLQAAISIIEKSIHVTNQGLDAAPLNRLNLSTMLATRFMQTGSLDDLQTAIKILEEAMEILPHSDLDRPRYQSNLITLLETRYRRVGNLDDIQKAISLGQEDSPTIQGHPGRPMMLGNIANCYRHRYHQTRVFEDLEIATKTIEEAIAMTPSPFGRASLLPVLMEAFLQKFKITNNPDDLNRALEVSQECIAATPDDHYGKAERLFNLGQCVMTKFLQNPDITYFERSISAFEEAAQSSNANIHVRISAAHRAGGILAVAKNWTKAAEMIEIGVRLLPLVTPRQLKQQDQQDRVKEFTGLASEASSIALSANKDAKHALQLLELGRGIITSLRFGNRSDITELKMQHPELADNFERLRNLLDSPGPSNLSHLGSIKDNFDNSNLPNNPDTWDLRQRQKMDQLNDANIEFNKIVNQIRPLANFENFLLPPKAEDLIAAASDLGTFVVINTSRYRCDAFIVDKNGIRSLHLPKLQQEDIESKVNSIRSIRSTQYPSSIILKQIFEILEWLWDVAVCPILNFLGFTSQPPLSIHEDNWPHVWWIPTGQLSLLPLHAAGRYSRGSTETTLDRVISSYSSSIKALIYSRYRQNPQDVKDIALAESPKEENREIILVSMDETPGQSDLSYVSQEISMVEGLLHDDNTAKTIRLERPCKKDVLEKLAQGGCKIFHFAGHGQSDPTDPSQSSLLVSDWKQNPLTVEDLMKLNLRQSFTAPWLAFLSACSTNDNNIDQLQDESINLVTSCQLAGFQHVVGTLWEVSDEHSVYAAEEVYKIISKAGDQPTGNGGALNGRSVALGVHRASRRLREITTQKYKARDKLTELETPPILSFDVEDEVCETGFKGSPEPSRGPDGEECGTRANRRLRPFGFEELDDNMQKSNPLIWAAYIHVGP